jgi:phosphoesterase RecJ-like protein
MSKQYKKLYELLSGAKTAAIVGHIRPDGDCIGSAVALKLALQGALGFGAADIYIDGEITSNFSYMPCFADIKTVLPAGEAYPEYDVLVVLDCNDENRLGVFAELRKHAAKVVIIDHHLTTFVDGDIVIADKTKASVGEILFDFFTQYKIEITKDIATALYTSVSSDTGCFLFPNTTSFTHIVAAALIAKGIDLEQINYYNFRVYESKDIMSLIFVLKSIRLFAGKQIAMVHLPYSAIRRFKFEEDIRHKAQKHMGDISGVKASVLLSEWERGVYHVSLRSHGDTNVGDVATVFGGGGHRNASGFEIKGPFAKVWKDILQKLEAAVR